MISILKSKLVFTLVVILGSWLPSELASAQGFVYLDNTSAAGISTSSTTAQVLTISFMTGNNAGGYTLDSIALLMSANSYAVGEQTSAYLYDIASDGLANNMEGNELNNFVTATGGYSVFTPDSLAGETSLLTPNTTYHMNFHGVELDGNPAPPFNVTLTSIMPTGTEGWSYDNPDPLYNLSVPIFDIIATPVSALASVSAVPEPGTLPLAGLASLAMCWRFRRKQ